MMKAQLFMLTAFIAGLFGVSINQTHFMSALLCIESMILTMFISSSTLAMTSQHSASTPIILLTIGACEAGAGLALLTALSHKNTNDLMKTLTLLQC
uniref:NADH-ubiquinone oxidoreductase chain 4L n=1 Tax=Draco maculatus TaxID=89026 RepID=A0A6F8CQI3_9SAUR|nr:NADH dehydrogenase subunit 4L [Draco maculatus]